MAWQRVVRRSLLLLVAGLAGPAGSAEVQIGAVFQPEFNGALGRLVTGNQRDLLFGETVYLNETVVTGPNSSTAVLFLDETRLQVGANSTVVLDRFVYDPAAGNGEAIIDFGQGIFRFISGEMPKEQVTLRTPTTVMAIRGTTLIVYVAPDDTTQIAVISGEVGVSPCGGSPVTAVEGYSASVSGDCSETAVVPGVITPVDPAVMADLDFSALSPAAGSAPDGDSSDRGGEGRAGPSGNAGSGGDPGGGDPGGGNPGGGDPGGGNGGGGDPGGGDPGGGDPGGGDPGGGDPGGGSGPGNGNGNGGNPGNGGGNTGGGGPGTGNGGPGTGNGGAPRGGQNANNVGQNGGQNGSNAGQND